MEQKRDSATEQTIFFEPNQEQSPVTDPTPKAENETSGQKTAPAKKENNTHQREKLISRMSRRRQPPPAEPASNHKEVTVVPQPKRKAKTPWSVAWSISTYVWKITLGLILVIGILLIGMVGYLSVSEYNPAYAEAAKRGSVNRTESLTNRTLSILSFNTGYGGLGYEADFFMDGGQGVLPKDEETVEKNMEGVGNVLRSRETDFIFLQEVDTDARRSFGKNQWLSYEHILKDYESRFALNYSCNYVPYPLTEPLGEIHSGLATYSKYDILSSTRYSLPNALTWPTRTAGMKRCLLVSRIPIDDSDKQLVLINVHMEAYDDGTTRTEQTAQLLKLVKEEYAKGNYVIAGGDFNQSFPKSEAFPQVNEEYWTPDKLSPIFAGWQYAFDDSRPTCRLLNQPYDPYSEETRYYVIDGFLVSPNVTVDSVETLNYHFRYSDHNPVLLEFTLNLDTEAEESE